MQKTVLVFTRRLEAWTRRQFPKLYGTKDPLPGGHSANGDLQPRSGLKPTKVGTSARMKGIAPFHVVIRDRLRHAAPNSRDDPLRTSTSFPITPPFPNRSFSHSEVCAWVDNN